MHPVLKEFSRKRILAYARAIPQDEFLGPTLFPVVNTNELTFEYWLSLNALAVSASLQAYGAEAQIAGRDGVKKVSGEIPPIKRKTYLDERNLIALKREGAGDNEMVRNSLYNDIDKMVEACYVRIERMRMDVLALGKMVLSENGVVLNVDYGVPNEHQVNPINAWDDPDKRNIIADLLAWTNRIEADTGVRPTRGVTSDTVQNYILSDATVRAMIWGPAGDQRPVTWDEVNRLLATMRLPQLATYNRRYRLQAEDGTLSVQRYFPEDRITLLPPTSLGETLMGPTAESMLDDEVEAKDVAGIYACVTHENEPPMIWTKASASSIPTFPAADLVYQAKVLS